MNNKNIEEIIIKHAFPDSLLDEVKGTKLKVIVEELSDLIQAEKEQYLDEFVEELCCGNEDYIGMEYTVGVIKGNAEQFKKESV